MIIQGLTLEGGFQMLPPVPQYLFQGSVAGYQFGGNGITTNMQKFEFSSSADASTIGNLQGSASNIGSTAIKSTTAGITLAYSNGAGRFESVSFATDGDAVLTGGDLAGLSLQNPVAISSSESGYVSGHNIGSTSLTRKFPYASPATVTVTGTLGNNYNRYSSSQNSTTHGYVSGGYDQNKPSPTRRLDEIYKFPFATDADATLIGNLNQGKNFASGLSSADYGYSAGGFTDGAGNKGYIEKFPFASDGNAAQVGELFTSGSNGYSYNWCAQSSTTDAYLTSGTGRNPVDITSGSNIIQRFPWASDSTSVDTGRITQYVTVNANGTQS
jgi:hypothetical protein